MTIRFDVIPLTLSSVFGVAAAQNQPINQSPLLTVLVGVAVGALGTVLWLYSPLPNSNGGIADPGGFHRQQWGLTTARPREDNND